MRRFDDLIRLLSGIHLYMVFFHFNFCRSKTVPAVHLIRNLFIALLPEPGCQFLLRKGMPNHNNWQARQIFSPLPLFFFGFRRGTAVSSLLDSSTATASDSLKNTIFPFTSIKEIRSSVSCLSDDLPKRCRFKSATCSNTS